MRQFRSLWLGLGVGAVVMVLSGQAVQPLPYSHKTHLAQGLKCNNCHPNPDPGDHMTFPPAATCMA